MGLAVVADSDQSAADSGIHQRADPVPTTLVDPEPPPISVGLDLVTGKRTVKDDEFWQGPWVAGQPGTSSAALEAR